VKVGTFEGGIAVLANEGITNFAAQFKQVIGRVVGEVTVLGTAPHRLDRVEVRCIARQPFDAQPPRSTLLQEADGLAMDVDPRLDDGALPAPPHCLLVSCILVRMLAIQWFVRYAEFSNSHRSVAALAAAQRAT
jgi:hypothetical protein